MEPRWIVLDVGETLVDETRVWKVWADALEIPQLTLMAALGAAVARGEEHQTAFDLLGIADWRQRWDSVRDTYGSFREEDLYPDALPTVSGLRDAGYRVGIFANQPSSRTVELRTLGFEPDAMAMSDEMRVAKPDPAFFARSRDLMKVADPGSVAYVGDRVDNDVLAAAAAGMRPVWVRRGPWGLIQELPEDLAEEQRPRLVVSTLAELVQRIEEIWT